MKISHRNIIIIAVAIIALVAIVASGLFGENPLSTFIGSPVSKKLTSGQTPGQVYNKYNIAIIKGDKEKACTFYTEAGQQQVIDDAKSTKDEGSTCAEVIYRPEGLEAMRNIDTSGLEDIVHDTTINGDTAVIKEDDDLITFKRINGEWKIDNIRNKREEEPADSETNSDSK